jgi:hypothetical protein
MAGWGWRRGGPVSAPADPKERDRRAWLTANGITPMNRSTRLWDMEIQASMLPHRVERVGSLDRTRRALNQQRAGIDFEPIKWQGSRDMATGRAYDFCYCIEAVKTEADGRVECKCQCVDCKPPGKDETPTHWRKRNFASQNRARAVRDQKRQNRWHRRVRRHINDWKWEYYHGYWFFQRWGWFGERWVERPAEDAPTPQEDHDEWYSEDRD